MSLTDLSGSRSTGPSGGVLVLVQCLLILTVWSFQRIYIHAGFTHEELIYPLSLVMTLSALWSFWSWHRLTGSIFDPYTIFLLAAFMFNAGQAFLEASGLDDQKILGDPNHTFRVEVVVSTLFLVLLGISAFHLGALLAAIIFEYRARAVKPGREEFNDRNSVLAVGWILLLASLPLWLSIKGDQITTVLNGGYMALYEPGSSQNSGALSYILADLIIPASIFLLLGSRPKHLAFVVAFAVLGVNVLLEFFLGYRGYAMWPLLAFAWAYHKRVRPISRSFLITGGLCMLFVVLPLVGAVRTESGEERTSIAYLMEAYLSLENPVVAIIGEMGGSMQTVAYTLELVPGTRDFENGLGYLYAFSTAIPNLFGGVHPAIAHGTASAWLVETVSPWTAERGGGYGYSFIAEAYLNFGWTGSVFALLVIGALFGYVFIWAMRGNDLLKIAAGAILLSFLTSYARGEAYTVVRAAVWYTAVPCLAVLLVSKHRRQSTLVYPRNSIFEEDRSAKPASNIQEI